MAGAVVIKDTSPFDWPTRGPIDLALHDLPHSSASTEWWYLNAHLRTLAGREVAVFASFFRVVKGIDEATKAPLYAHSLTWALSDLEASRYVSASYVDRDAPKMGRERMKRGEGTRDERLRRALKEVIDKNKVPYPDRMFAGEVRVARDRLALDFSGARFEKNSDGTYTLALRDEDQKTACCLTFELQKQPVRHGDNGVVRGPDGGDMFYYFVPRCHVTGTVTFDGVDHPARGDGWYDHEFGGLRPSDDRARTASHHEEAAWNWLALQFADGTELTAYEMVRPETGESMGSKALLIGADGTRHEHGDLKITPLNSWTSTRTFNTYPTAWRLEVPAAGVDLVVDAAFQDQEFVTLISKPAFWEGRCETRGTVGGAEVTGRGYFERSGFPCLETLDEFFGAVGKEVRRSVQRLIPFDPSYERVRDLVASEERDHTMRGVDVPAFVDSMIRPVREITDRGGKSWRSYAALACCDVVGGDSRLYVEWLAMPEFLHVGSLIVDDVEDRSTVRRGGPTCHMIYGEPIAINAGTACYFLGHKLLKNKNLNDADKLRIYDLYFEALRAGHSGQALDLYGLDQAMSAAVTSGDGETLENRVAAIHTLKTAAPAAGLARMGAVAGGGDDTQIEALGRFFEAVGLAFQIMDDVLNLRGFKGDLKSKGEDITRGVVTLPVAKAITRMQPEARRELWNTLQSKPTDWWVVEGVIKDLEACGAVDACVQQAKELVESAWEELDPLVEDSLPKLMLRAFGWYVLERQY